MREGTRPVVHKWFWLGGKAADAPTVVCTGVWSGHVLSAYRWAKVTCAACRHVRLEQRHLGQRVMRP